MTHQQDVRAIVDQFFEAFNANDASLFRNGLICDDQVFFDTRPLIQGSA